MTPPAVTIMPVVTHLVELEEINEENDSKTDDQGTALHKDRPLSSGGGFYHLESDLDENDVVNESSDQDF